ncbi:MAG: hypothetical protein KDJ38_12675 [Gammaproteobacteria bacterium]|nr:hypothetical protein [Gammaproteobacteria bacterium]
MKTMKNGAVLILVVLLLAACASLSPPKRAAYTGQDQVGAVDANMLIGSWNGEILNPIEGEQDTVYKIEYRADGTVTSYSRTKDSSGVMGPMEFEITGTWKVDGELVTQTAEEIREVSGNKLAAMVASMMGSMKEKMTGTANIYEASADRIVLVADEGQAQALTRIK